MFRRAIKASGEDPGRVTAYALRHSWIVRQLLANVPVRLVATMADTSIAMIEKTYSAHIDQHGDDLIRAALPDVESTEGDVVPLRR
jgi:integrase